MTKTSDIKKMLRKRKTLKRKKKTSVGLSSGSTILNLSCSGDPSYALLTGHYYLLAGDSSAGKTWLSMSFLAEASIDSKFNDYTLIYDDVEGGALMDVERYFGSKLAKRLTPPQGTKLKPVYSSTTEEMYDSIEEHLDKGPIIYITDSLDSLDTEDDDKKLTKMKSARKKGKAGEESGSYGTAKAKLNSMRLRRLMSRLKKTGSILIFISQSRDKIGGFMPFPEKTRAGGHALTFYATLEIWLKRRKKVTKTVKGKKRTIGIISQMEVKKNRVQGKNRIAYVPIYYSVGIDDIGGCINWMVDEGGWKGTQTKVKAPEFDFSGDIEKLVAKIEEEEAEDALKSVVKQTWDEIEKACTLKRKNKYEEAS